MLETHINAACPWILIAREQPEEEWGLQATGLARGAAEASPDEEASVAAGLIVQGRYNYLGAAGYRCCSPVWFTSPSWRNVVFAARLNRRSIGRSRAGETPCALDRDGSRNGVGHFQRSCSCSA